MTGGAIEIEGRRFAWRATGRGPALLLVNGYASTGADWDPGFLMGLARRFEVICPDNRGFGGSELGEGELTVDRMAADLEALLDALEIERAPLVGWSLGGFVAQRLAACAPERVASMALLATDPGAPDAVPASAEAWARLLDHSGAPRAQASRLISLLFPPGVAEDVDRQFGEIVAAAREQLSPEALRAQEAAMEAWHRDELPRAACRARSRSPADPDPPRRPRRGHPSGERHPPRRPLARRPGRALRVLRPRPDGPGAPTHRRPASSTT